MNISIDVGGTNTRLQFETIQNGQQVETSGIFKAEINSKQNLQDFIGVQLISKKNFPINAILVLQG